MTMAAEETLEESGTDISSESPWAHLEDGRTRCAWVRGRPEHYEFHDAEWGRLPDGEETCFEMVLLACLSRGRELVDVLDHRVEVYEAFGEWNMEAVAGADDASLEALTQRGGIFADANELRWIRDVAAACVATAKDYKGLREYFLALPSLPSDEKILECADRFPGFEKDDAARLLEMVAAIESDPHQRDCWICRL